MNNEHTVATNTTLQSLNEEARKEWDRILECLPPQWCSDCKTLGCGFGEEDRICGNCNGTHVVAFKVALDTLIEKAYAAGKEEEFERMADAICEIIVQTDWANESTPGIDRLSALAARTNNSLD